jgi:pimeloyl-ACP methyl ester carboxylesterase
MPPLHVETSGDGPVVVLIHSSGLSGRQWRRLASSLAARGFRAVVPDLTGHGASAPYPEPTPFSYRTDVAALRALLETSGPAHLVGHSYGGLLALLAAVEAPQAVRSMVLYDPVAFGVLDPVADADARAELAAVDLPWGTSGTSEREHDAWLQAFVDYWGGPGAWLLLREEARAEFRRVGWVVEQGVSTLVDDQTPAAAYRALAFPVTLMTGERSPLAAGAVVRRLAAACPDARVVTMPGAGHMGPLSHSGTVNDAIIAALGAT